jgi:hypothetical protein
MARRDGPDLDERIVKSVHQARLGTTEIALDNDLGT